DTENWLSHERGDLAGGRRHDQFLNVVSTGQAAFRISKFERAAITIRRRRMDKTGDLRRQRPPGRMAHRGKGGRRTSAVCVTQHDDLMTASCQFRCMHGSVIGFSAAVCEKRFLQTPRGYLRQLLSQIRLWLVRVKRCSCAVVNNM